MSKLFEFIHSHFIKGFKFAVIGGIGAVINITIQYFCTEILGIYYIFSAVIGFSVSFVNNYFLNYYWTFRK